MKVNNSTITTKCKVKICQLQQGAVCHCVGIYTLTNWPFYSSQRHIGDATGYTWERGWGWLVLNLCERFRWNSYLGSKIFQFLRKMDGPSWNLDKANFSPKKKGEFFGFWLFKYILWPQWFAYKLSLLQVYARRLVFLLSIIDLYLCYSLGIMDEGDYCCKISTNFQLGTWIVLSSIEFFFIAAVSQ